MPDIQPLKARRVRFTNDEENEMLESRGEEKVPRKAGSKGTGPGDKENAPPKDGTQKSEELTPLKATGRQSELTSTVDTQNIMERILDTPVLMTMREIMVTSKELRTEFQDLIKVKNVRAVLLGESKNHPLIAAVGWPRTDGILIKIDMKTGGNDVCAIIDTGSQLDVVNAQTAALKIQQAVDMSQVTSMKDANGGQGQLQGWIRDVEFTCGAAVTVTDLWVSQQAPFSLLLGRPWQRGNLVSIDEREEGTYLVFKDRETRRPRYELLAVPYDGPPLANTVNTQQYQSFVYWDDEDSPIKYPVPSSEPYSAWYVGEKRRMIQAIPRPATLENIRSLMLEGTVRSKRAQVTEGWETHDRSGRVESKKATRELVQAVSGLSTVLGIITRRDDVPDFVGRSERARVLKGGGEDKPPSSNPTLDQRALVNFMSAVQSTIRPSNRRVLLPHLQEIQYLSRSQFASPPLSAVALNASGPVATIVDAVTQQWQGLHDDQPLVANPTFVAAPNAIYHGEVQLPSGQILHRSTALNAFRVIRNGETGLPVTMSCHEFTFHLAAPDNLQQVWELEAPYPTDERLQQAMATMSPEALEELGYPTRATKEAPPMMPMEQRVRLNQVDSSDTENGNGTHLPLPQFSRDGAAPAEDVIAQPVTAVSPLVLGITIDAGLMRVASDVGEIERPTTPSFGKEGRQLAQHELAREIHRRAKSSLRLDGDELFDSDSDTDSMPALESVSSSDESSLFSVDLGLCNLCFEPHHAATCPLIETTLQQSARDEEATKKSDDPTDLRRALDAALGPFLSEWIELPEPSPLQTLVVAAHEARQAFEEEFSPERMEREAERTVALLERAAVDALQEMARGRSSDEESSLGSSGDQFFTATRQEDRADSPYPRSRQEVRADSPYPRSRRSHWPNNPRFTLNPNSGIVVTRDTWSSSESPRSSSDSGSDSHYDNPGCLPAVPEVEPLTPGNWSPPASWVVHASSPAEFSSDSDSDGDSEEDELFPNTPDLDGRDLAPRYEFFDQHTAQILGELQHWVHAGVAQQEAQNQWEEDLAAEPGNLALQTLHGRLRRFLDYTAMAVEGVLRSPPSPPPYPFMASFQVTPDDEPGPDATSTTLDHSLPTTADPTLSVEQLTTNEYPQTGGGVKASAEGDVTGTINVTEDEASGRPELGTKRKHPEGEQNGLNQHVTREALRASGLTETAAIRLFAGVRHAILETGILVEETVWPRFGITKESLPTHFRHHPLLFDLEVAKLQTLAHVLQRHGREELAHILHELLAIRLRDDYVVSQMLSAGFLDFNYPEDISNYQELLRNPDSFETHHRNYSTAAVYNYSTESDSDSDSELLYPPSDSEGDQLVPLRVDADACGTGVSIVVNGD
ncbi:hypothetical protein K438DRAFT_1991221 [Mycena galopus ATCC 62051]|nr:hypothetical protein K438DRAFT_1991221 [Mycena galopus ATCC 62051]